MKMAQEKRPTVLRQSSKNSEAQASLDNSAIPNRAQKIGEEESTLLS
ncbi:hypothetical protein [Nostoc sp.]